MGRLAHVRRTHSTAIQAADAARELHEGLYQAEMGLVAFFCSSSFDLDVLGQEIHQRFAGTTVIGCTTAGEITPAGYMEGSITGFSIAAAECCAVTELIPSISQLQIPRGAAAVDSLIAALAERGQAVDLSDTFGMLLIDGMGTTEELVLTAVYRRLDPIPLLGGSAGDDMRLERTYVYHDGKFHSDAALLSLIKIRLPFRVFRHQHFSGTETRMVVTGADPQRRIVTEINAEPAGPEYARILGLSYADLTPMIFAEFPVMVRVGGDFYVRSIQKTNEDGSLTFFCAIDEGVVLTLGHHEDMIDSLRRFFRQIRHDIGEPQLVVGFDCVLRSLEAESRQAKHLASQVMVQHNVIGFSTYGEQFAGMHVNQTFTGVYFGSRPDE
jgi:hypothetical protein